MQHFGVKTLPVQDMERCYLQKKICVTTWDFKNDLVVVVWLLHGIHELHCGINVYKKNSVVSIFKWVLAWKRGLLKPKFSYKNLSSSTNILYTITKMPKRVICGA